MSFPHSSVPIHVAMCPSDAGTHTIYAAVPGYKIEPTSLKVWDIEGANNVTVHDSAATPKYFVGKAGHPMQLDCSSGRPGFNLPEESGRHLETGVGESLQITLTSSVAVNVMATLVLVPEGQTH